MNRTGALAVLALGLLAVGVPLSLRWPSAQPALDCEPERVRLNPGPGAARVAQCDPSPVPAGEVPAHQALTLGRKLALNAASEQDLAALPGVGKSLARRLVQSREALGRFRSWNDVDEVPGVGLSTLRTLMSLTTL